MLHLNLAMGYPHTPAVLGLSPLYQLLKLPIVIAQAVLGIGYFRFEIMCRRSSYNMFRHTASSS